MRRITYEDELLIIRVIDACPPRTCSWETIREELAKSVGGLGNVWSRQALKTHPNIYIQYLAKVQSRRAPVSVVQSETGAANPIDSAHQVCEETRLQELQRKYDALALRYRQVIFNASLLPGGLRLLIEPLPKGQQERDRSQAAGRRGSR